MALSSEIGGVATRWARGFVSPYSRLPMATHATLGPPFRGLCEEYCITLVVSLRFDAVGEHVSGDGDGGVVVARVLDLHRALPPLLGVLQDIGL